MGNTEINSLFEIAINLENKCLYVQADKARNIMVRLSQVTQISALNNEQTKIQELIKLIISKISALGPFLKAAGFSNFLSAVKVPPVIAKNLAHVFPIAMGVQALNSLNNVVNLSSKFNWDTFFSGEDTSGQEIVIEIFTALENFCFLFENIIPALRPWSWTFLGLASGGKSALEKAKTWGYAEGGMPGGEEQMHKISTFDLRDPENITDPDAKFIIDSIMKELGVDLSNPKAKENASKLPKILGGLDFFIPYIKKYDRNNKFKNLNDPTIPENLQLRNGLLDIQSKIKLFRGDIPASSKPAKTTTQPKGK